MLSFRGLGVYCPVAGALDLARSEFLARGVHPPTNEDRSHWDCPVSVFGNVEAARQTLEKKSAQLALLHYVLLPRHHS